MPESSTVLLCDTLTRWLAELTAVRQELAELGKPAKPARLRVERVAVEVRTLFGRLSDGERRQAV